MQVMHLLNLPPMPWQEQVALVGGEYDPETGIPCYREVAFTVPRQSGKTTVVLGWELQRAIGWDDPQRIVYSAQTGNDARKKLIEDQVPLLDRRKAKFGITRILKGMGNEAIEFRNGSRIALLTGSEQSGHGKTIDLGVKDELFKDVDDRRDQALIPAMSTRARAQSLAASTAGTDESLALNRLITRGRAAVEGDVDGGLAYFEWSMPDDGDIDDEDEWRRCMPALGHTISVEVVRHARATLTEGEFRRAFCNIGTRSDERVIPGAVWDACSGDYGPTGQVTFGVDCNPERSWAAIASSDAAGVGELVEHRAGTGWLVDRVHELCERWKSNVVLDVSGPAGFFVRDLQTAGVTVVELASRDITAACAELYVDVVEGRARLRRHDDLDKAVAGARKRTVGDAWVWARRDLTVDVSPLTALTVARWVAKHQAPAPFFIY